MSMSRNFRSQSKSSYREAAALQANSLVKNHQNCNITAREARSTGLSAANQGIDDHRREQYEPCNRKSPIGTNTEKHNR